MARRISLREFQESLAKRLAEAQSSTRRSYLGVQAGDENWLIQLGDSGEILPVPPLARVPLTQRWFAGIANVRGTLYGVVDLSAFHGGRPTTPTGAARLVLIGAKHGINSALLVNRALGLRDPEDFEPAPDITDQRSWVAQPLRDPHERTWFRLDTQTLMGTKAFLDAESKATG